MLNAQRTHLALVNRFVFFTFRAPCRGQDQCRAILLFPLLEEAGTGDSVLKEKRKAFVFHPMGRLKVIPNC
jgi:hypothetical protein